MTFKRYLLLLLLAIGSLGGAQAQLVFTPSEWDFGTIRESDGRVSHTFTGTNRGSKPVVILDVVTTCGCTRPEFTQRPIVAGGKTQITVTYDPANRPGTFDKQLDVYSSERVKVATLTIRGKVLPRQKTTEELYPIDAGNGLRLNSTLSAFSYVYPGRRAQSSIGYVNTSSRPVTLELRPQQASGVFDIKAPRQIAPGARGEIDLAYDIPATAPRYGTLRDVFEVVVDNRTNSTTIMAHAIGVDIPAERGNTAPPKAEISENMLKFGPVKHAGPVQRRTFSIANTGGGELIIRSVENQGRVATTLMPGRRIAAGDSITAEVMIDPRSQEFGILTDHLIVVTNDPDRPMRRLRVTAIIEQ